MQRFLPGEGYRLVVPSNTRAKAEDLLQRLFQTQVDTAVVHVWRGQADERWELFPTLYRRLLNRHQRSEVTEDLVRRYELDLLCESNGLGFYRGDRLKTMVDLQHHGGATRFLDITRNVFVALWFATEIVSDDANGVVYHFGLPSGRVHRYDRMSSFDDIVDDRHSGKPFVFFPRPEDERIRAQQAGFISTVLVEPLSSGSPFVEDADGMTVEVLQVPYELKAYLRKHLERSVGLDAVGIYPDFAGYALANSARAPFPREFHELYDGSAGIFPNPS